MLLSPPEAHLGQTSDLQMRMDGLQRTERASISGECGAMGDAQPNRGDKMPGVRVSRCGGGLDGNGLRRVLD